MNLFKKIFHIQDTPDSSYGREWRWWITTSSTPTYSISLELQLIRWKGKLEEPRAVGMYSLLFYLKPSQWKIESVHIYYDGPNCHWQFGPIGISRSGFGDCEKCNRE